MPRPRSVLLRLIAEGQFPLGPLREELSSYPWDADEPLIVIDREHVQRILDRYTRGELSVDDVREWAEALEVRDDVDFPEDESAVKEALFVLANPDLNGPLSVERARAMRHALDLPPTA